MAGKRKVKTQVTAVIAVILVVIIVVIALLWYFKPQFFHKLLGTGGHYWGEWETTAEATCVDEGEAKRSCTVCGEDETKKIEATGHDYGDWISVSNPTCEGFGSDKRICATCEHEESRRLLPTGHTFGDWITDEEPTCGEEGLRHHTCLTCKTDIEEVIPATGNHTDADEDGICDDCGQTVSITGSLEDIDEADFSIHFLELGNKYAGDSLLIKCGDTEVLIDAGSRQSSAATIKQYIDNYCSDGVLEYVIATHADQDHISGFVGLAGNPRTGILYQYKIGTIITFDNVKPDNENASLYKSFHDAVAYPQRHGPNDNTPSQCY
ncbi:MAG: MBL fold metallo-hydrolase, partial [Clostridia bacterium]|nr:MBL fold metallo-hydrolase [Clostridia bacterium]